MAAATQNDYPARTASSARSRTAGRLAWAIYDWANSAFPTVITTFVFAAYFTRKVASNETVGTTQWGTTLGAAGLIIALVGPMLGAMADQTGRRKPWIAGFTALCVVATAGLWWVRPSADFVGLALGLLAVGTMGAEFACIFYNAMLPELAPRDRVGRWSGWAWGLGYAGGLSCLAVALLALVRSDGAWLALNRDAAEHVRATFFLVAGWYAVFALPLLLVTPDTPASHQPFARVVADGWRQLVNSIRNVRRHLNIVRFLVARMIYTDGLATVFAFGGVYAAGTFGMNEQEVITFGIALNVTAGLGAVALAWVDDWIGGQRTILMALSGLMVSVAALLLAPSKALFWAFGLGLGVFVGPVQSASRSFMARLAPPPLRSQMFGLYAFSGKATAFLGPLVVGWLTYLSGSQRVGVSAVLVFFILGFALLLTVQSPARESP